MQNTKKVSLIFPFHDPKKRFGKILFKNIPLLKEAFSEIFISATHPTIKENKEAINFLGGNNCNVFKNEEGTSIGNHYRGGLKIYLENSKNDQVLWVY